MEELTPRQIVAELDKYIIGQEKAKKAVAIVLRNRYRRRLLPKELQDEVVPKNILMIGPTGVGKTEIARRLARLARAPFIKVEATKFTEVGYVGRDVESMVRELVETSIRMVKAEKMEEVKDRAAALAEERLVELLVPAPARERSFNPLGALFGFPQHAAETTDTQKEREELEEERRRVRAALAAGELEDRIVEIQVEENRAPGARGFFWLGGRGARHQRARPLWSSDAEAQAQAEGAPERSPQNPPARRSPEADRHG